MKKIDYRKAQFLKTAMEVKELPKANLPEIAIVGRSNVGKSTLLNHLFQNRSLVKTSQKPGKTQGMNAFLVDEALSVIDLPGYGFAKVPEAVRTLWGPMMQDYLESRESLKLILFLFDIRRLPNDDDHQLIEWLQFHQRSVIVVFTKVDKLLKGQEHTFGKRLLELMRMEGVPHVFYSAPKNVGRKELLLAVEQKI